MMVPFSTLLSTHIRFLLQSLDGSNFDSVFPELCKCTEYGAEGSIFLLRTCLESIDIYGEDLKNIHLNPALVAIFKYLVEKPNFSTLFCQSVRSEAMRDGFLDDLSHAFCLSVSEKIAIGLALLDSENDDTQTCGKTFCLSQIESLTSNPSALGSTEQIQQILVFLRQSEDLSRLVDTFISMLSLVPLKESCPSLLHPLTSNESDEACLLRNLEFLYDGENDFDAVIAEMQREVNIADIMKELSYGCTDDAKNCRYILSLITPLTESVISRIIGTVACTQGGIVESQNAYQVFLSAMGYSPTSDLPVISTWNINLLLDTIKELAPDTNWVSVMEKLDYDGFCIPDESAFACLMSIYKLACQDLITSTGFNDLRQSMQDPFPLGSICGPLWNNAEGQLSILKYAVSSSEEVFTFSHSARQVELIDSNEGLKLQSRSSNHAWFCLDLLDVLCQLAENGYKTYVLSILEYSLKHCPEILLLGLAQIKTSCNLVPYELSLSIFPGVICSNHKNGVILQLWLSNPLLLMQVFAEVLVTDAVNIAQIVDVCNEIKILNHVLMMMPFAVAIRLAVAAFRKELLDLETWLSDNLVTYRDTFFEECLKYLKEIQFGTSQQGRVHHSGASFNIHSQDVAVFFKVLEANSHSLGSSNLCDEMDKLSISFNHGSLGQNDGNADASASVTYGDKIEAEANAYFQQMFSEQFTISEMVQMLSRFKDSSDPREKSIFECVINNLLEEYKFFPKYPEKQLGLAAVLFGSVIKNQLVTHLTLGIAIRYVLDSLRKPADSKMFGFGTKALEQFINRLDEWPQYCNHILQISHLRGTHPELVAYIEDVLTRRSHGGSGLHVDHLSTSPPANDMNELIGSNGEQSRQLSTPLVLEPREHNSLNDGNRTSTNSILRPPLSSTTPSFAVPSSEVGNQKLQSAVTAPTVLSSSPGVARQSRGVTSARFGSPISIETLISAAERRETPIEAPASEVQDKVSFTINNLSAANIEAKAKEFCDILKEQYYPWFSQYMVMKRASIEPNFHELYLKFLEKANSKALNKEIVQTTYENCKVLLGSELIKSSSEERSLLKNLGSWLGKLTIGRNQVLRARDIDPKSLIVKAYEKGLMIAVIPFTSKILEPCQSSLAYQPPNPWTMGILALLVEIYAMPNLKMNLKFDIEVLFKNLGVNMKDVTPTSLLKDRVRVVEGNPDFSNKDTVVSHPPAEDKPGKMTTLNPLDLPLEVAGPSHLGAHPRSISPYGVSSHPFMEDEKLAAIGFPDQLPAAQALLPSAASQSPFSIGQLPAIASITQHIVVNPKIIAMGLHTHFQRFLPIAIERAIKEIVPGIVQRSVSIAIQTTKELVIKDYALESDESRIYNAAHLMVGSLAGSLAHVTCKEPLRASMSSQLRNMLQGLNIANELLETAILNATNDNLDLGCAHIENSAAEKALEMVDAEIAQQLTLRRKQSLASSMYDPSGFSKGPMSVLPETLQPKPGRVSLSQQRVYEDFVRLPWQTQQTSSSTNAMLAGPPAGANVPRPFSLSSEQLNPGAYSSGMGNTGLGAAQPLNLASDEIDMPLAQIFSAPSANLGRITDVAVQQRADIDVTMTAPSLILAIPDSLPADSTISVKDSGTPPQSLPLQSASEHVGTVVSESLLTTGDALDKYQLVASKLEDLLANDGRETEIQSVVSEVPRIISRCITADEAALALAQKVFKSLYETSSNSFHVGTHLAILVAIRDVCKLVVKELTNWVIYSDDERKFNRDITVGLMRRELLNLAEYNIHVAKLLDAGRNKPATEFAISLIQTLLVEEPEVLPELHNVVETLAKLAARPGSPESLQQLVEIARNPSVNISAVSSIIAGIDDKSRQTRDKKVASQALVSRGEYNHIDVVEPDSSVFHEQVSLLFAEWFRICEVPAANAAAASNFILQLHQNGFLKGDDTSDRFFRRLLELSVSHCLTTEVMSTQQSSQQAQPLSFLAIDIYSKLVFSILKYFPVEQGSSKLFLLPKILTVTVRFIQKDVDDKKSSFNARPYFRLFINWLSDIGSLDPIHDGVNLQVLIAFANAFHILQPLKVPAFSFVWLELVSHRTFMPKLLTGNSQKGWPYLHRLLVGLFQFMEPFLRNAELGEPIRFLYRGTLRVLLVLLHDFPEFLCDYHFSFCDVIPPSCIQMRNIVLSAFPRNMRLPDPSTPNLKIDLLTEMSHPPRILSEVDAGLKAKQMKTDVDEYLKTRQQQGSSILIELKKKLLLSQNEAHRTGTRYNVPLINSLVLYVGIQAIQQLQTRAPSQQQSVNNSPLVDAALDIFHTLIMDLDTEGRYLFLNAIANQLRYPNNHTHYFSFILLHLFYEANQEIIQEQITRVLLERLIVNRPHPWGLLITFIELIKNPRYSFWNRSFTRCAPEIEKLFESVSRSCGGPKPVNEGMVVGSGALSESAH